MTFCMQKKLSGKPKVLFILHLPPPLHGASTVNNYIRNSAIINKEFETEYINLATNKKLNESGQGSTKKVFTFIFLITKIIRLLSLKNYDLCYVSLTASGPAFYKDLVIVTILKLFKRKIIYHFHNKGVALSSANKVNNYLYKYAFKNTFSILLSRYLYSDIEKYVKKDNVFFCPCGIPTAGIVQDEERRIENTSTTCRLLFLSNMLIEKGVFVLLDACKQLKEKKYKFKCNFVGGWADITPQEFDNYVLKNDLCDIVFAHGPKYDQEKLSFYARSDIFIFPTYNETFGIVNLEAMQHGLAIVSTPEGGIPDVVIDGETGFIVPQKNADALTNKLEILIQQPELRIKMGEAGKRRFQNLFTIEKFEIRVSDIIKNSIARK